MLLQDILSKSSLYITLIIAENIALKIADALEFPLTAASLQNSISNLQCTTLY